MQRFWPGSEAAAPRSGQGTSTPDDRCQEVAPGVALPAPEPLPSSGHLLAQQRLPLGRRDCLRRPLVQRAIRGSPGQGLDTGPLDPRLSNAAYVRRDARPFLGHSVVTNGATRGGNPDHLRATRQPEQRIREPRTAPDGMRRHGAARTTSSRRLGSWKGSAFQIRDRLALERGSRGWAEEANPGRLSPSPRLSLKCGLMPVRGGLELPEDGAEGIRGLSPSAIRALQSR